MCQGSRVQLVEAELEMLRLIEFMTAILQDTAVVPVFVSRFPPTSFLGELLPSHGAHRTLRSRLRRGPQPSAQNEVLELFPKSFSRPGRAKPSRAETMQSIYISGFLSLSSNSPSSVDWCSIPSSRLQFFVGSEWDTASCWSNPYVLE